MNILFLCNIKDNNKTGLFNTVSIRTSNIIKNNFECKNYLACSVVESEKTYLRIIKNILKKKVFELNYTKFISDNILFNYVIYKKGLLDIIKSKINYNCNLKEELLELEKKVDFKKFDIIQVHWAYPVGYLAKMIKDKYKIPYVLTVHGSDIHTMPFKNKKICKYTIKALNSANKVIFVSNNLLEKSKELGYKGLNAEVIHNGVNINTFKIQDKQQIKNECKFYNKKVVGFVGNLVWIKRADKLPKIFQYIKSEYKDVGFLVVGDGELRKYMENKCSQIGIKVKFTGKVIPNKVSYYMNAMDVMILPSRREGFGNVILEANACGVTVVGSDNGGIPEAIGDRGICVKDGENFEKRLAAEVVKLFRNDNINSKNLRNQVKKYSWENIARKEFQIYQRIIKDVQKGF